MDETEEILVDARGHRCPVPTLRLRRAFEAAPKGASLRLLADDPMARIDIPHFIAGIEARIVEVSQVGEMIDFLVVKDF